jgi:hypothetical protein
MGTSTRPKRTSLGCSKQLPPGRSHHCSRGHAGRATDGHRIQEQDPLGFDRGRIWIADDFDAPLPDDLLKAFYDGEIPKPEPKRRKRKGSSYGIRWSGCGAWVLPKISRPPDLKFLSAEARTLISPR